MKCACGYEYKTEWDSEKRKSVVVCGCSEFIKINVTATREGDGYHREIIPVYVYCCPECGTLRRD